MKASILVGDVLDRLRLLPDASVQCCVTSPPYWGLRDYGVTGQLGLEPTPELYIQRMTEVFAEVWRVLRKDGVLWCNIGDSYASAYACDRRSVIGNGSPDGDCKRPNRLTGDLKEKDLVGIPWMLAFALRADGWWLRQDIIWSKPNPMPESVQDRCTKAHEYLFLLTKSAKYFYDAEAIAEASLCAGQTVHTNGNEGMDAGYDGHRTRDGMRRGVTVKDTRNKRSVWEIATQPYPEAHFATFPEALVEPCILAGSKPGDTVLDPFCGSGTTGVVALRYQRDFIGIELNPSYAQLAEKRIGQEAPMFNQIEVTA